MLVLYVEDGGSWEWVDMVKIKGFEQNLEEMEGKFSGYPKILLVCSVPLANRFVSNLADV